jgi:hypothetical protein
LSLQDNCDQIRHQGVVQSDEGIDTLVRAGRTELSPKIREQGLLMHAGVEC